MVSLEPWSKSTARPSASEPRLGRWFEAVPEPEAVSEVARQRVRLRLQRGVGAQPRLMLVRLVAVGAVIGMTGAAAAQWTAQHLLSSRHEVTVRPSHAVAPQPALPRAVEKAPPPTAEPVPVAVASASAVFSAFPAPAATSSSRLGLEAASLQAALSTLRGGATERALIALDEHRRDFPQGTLDLEARVARVEALLKLKRRQEAQRELSTLPLDRVGRGLELRLIRAELGAEGDCRGSLADFDVLLGQSLPAAWMERALFGRGACLLKLGDHAGAQRDFSRYLEQFPSGRFAPQIRAQGASVSNAGR